MRNPLSTALCLLVLATSLFAQDFPRDPWVGYGIDSWTKIKSTGPDGLDLKKTKTTIATYRVAAAGEDVELAVEEYDLATPEEITSSTQFHVFGALPKEMDYRLTTDTEATVKIGGEPRKTQMRVYESEPGKSPYADMPPVIRNMLEAENPGQRVHSSVTFWELDGADVPYHEIAQEGRDLAMGPTIVAVKSSNVFFNAKGEVVSKELIVGKVSSFDATLTVADKEVSCVKFVFAIESFGEVDDKPTTQKGKRELWLSKRVPGHEVLVITSGSHEGIEFTSREEVLDFKATSSRGPDLTKLPPLAERKAITQKGWNGLHVGGWKAKVGLIIQEGGVQAQQELVQVLDATPEGLLVHERTLLDDGTLQDSSIKRVPIAKEAEDAKVFARGKKTLSFLNDKKIETEWTASETTEGNGPTKRRRVMARWTPADPEQARPVGFEEGTKAIKLFERETITGKDFTRETTTLTRLLELDRPFNVLGENVKCDFYLTLEKEGKTLGWSVLALSESRPAHVVSHTIRGEVELFGFVIDYGEYEDAFPDDVSMADLQKQSGELYQGSQLKLKSLLERYARLMITDIGKLEKELTP